MTHFDLDRQQLVGAVGSLPVLAADEITRKLAMLLEGECEGLGPNRAAQKFGFSKQRYFQLRAAFRQGGALALLSHKRGPKTNYRRSAEVIRQVIRYRFLDPESSAEVIAQKLTQSGWPISIGSVHRVIEDFGLQKNSTNAGPRVSSLSTPSAPRNARAVNPAILKTLAGQFGGLARSRT